MRRYLLAAAALLAAWSAGSLAAAPSIDSVMATRIKDYRGTATLGEANLSALRKIGKDYANAYRAKTMDTYFKEPGKMRVEARAYGATFTQVTNGNQKYTTVFAIRSKDDISRKPQTRQTSLEIGFITPSAMRDYTAKYLRRDGSSQVFELRFKQPDQRRKKILLWVDPSKRILVRRELYRDDGGLKARFGYESPKQVAPGIWVPTRLTVHNAEGELGGVTTYGNLHVNTGLAEKLFAIP